MEPVSPVIYSAISPATTTTESTFVGSPVPVRNGVGDAIAIGNASFSQSGEPPKKKQNKGQCEFYGLKMINDKVKRNVK
jgi:hypothetical protein